MLDLYADDPDFRAWEKWAWAKRDPANWPVHHMLYRFAQVLRAKRTVEIGIGRGMGTYILGTHAKLIGGIHTAIDIAPNTISRAQQIKDAFDLPIDIIHADSKTVEWKFWTDLIYVDGGHSEEQVLGDIKAFQHSIHHNGLMIFDDYFRKHHGVTEAVDKAHNPERYEMSKWPWFWWAIWRRL